MFTEEGLLERCHRQRIARVSESVTFIGKHHEINRQIPFRHCGRDCLALTELDPGVIGAMPQQQRSLNCLNVNNRLLSTHSQLVMAASAIAQSH